MENKKSPIDWFFSLGDRMTKGDPKRLLDWNYYMLLIMFIAFISVFIGNIIDFYYFQKLANLGWAVVMIAILWFQYSGLKNTYETRKMMKNPLPQEKLESEKDMLENFVKGGLETQDIKMNNKKCEICGKKISEDRDLCEECIDKNIRNAWHKRK